MKAVILAGGKGTELQPLTNNLPKPMVPLLDRPVMEYTLELLKRHGITEIAVMLQHLPDLIRRHFGDGSAFGVQLHYIEEELSLGTAGSIRASGFMLDDTFLVIRGDILTDIDLSAAVSFHLEKRADATILLAQGEPSLEAGLAVTDAEGKVTHFLKSVDWNEAYTDAADTGIYLLEPDVLRYCDRGPAFDFGRDLFPMLMMMRRPLYGWKAPGYWSDIGSFTQYRKTQFDMLDGKAAVRIPGTEVRTGVWVGDGAAISDTAIFEAPAYIGQGAILDGEMVVSGHSVIGSGCLLKKGTRLERSILWEQSVVGENAKIIGAILGRRVVVQAKADLQDGVVIGDRAFIGTQSYLHRDTKVWPGKVVDSYAFLAESLIWGETGRRTLFKHSGVQGSCYGELTPVMASKLAQAHASELPLGQTVGIGNDGSPYSVLLADALSVGFHSSGINTRDFGQVTSAVTRHAIHTGTYAAGVHVRRMVSPIGAEEYIIELMDHRGGSAGGDALRKIEQAYALESSRPIFPHQTGYPTPVPEALEWYREQLVQTVSVKAIQEKGLRAVVRCGSRVHGAFVPWLQSALGCSFVHVCDESRDPASLSAWTKDFGADMGISWDEDGRLVHMAMENGAILDQDEIDALHILLRLREGECSLPIGSEGFNLPFDGVYMTVRLLDWMASEKLPLSRLLAGIPRLSRSRKKVDCPWAEKGRIMRFLVEEASNARVELTDGIKVYDDSGWIWILPDLEEPALQVVAEDRTKERADSKASKVADKIAAFRQKGAFLTG